MREFLGQWGSLVVALVALVQPWLIALGRRLLQRGDLENYQSGRFEIGYSGFGPTIGLQGTLRAIHREQFVHRMDVTVTRLKDHSEHSFAWAVFRPLQLALGAMPNTSVEVASAFLLTTPQPHRYSVLFVDSQTQNDLAPHVLGVGQEWSERVAAMFGGLPESAPGTDLAEAVRPVVNQAYNEFASGETYRRASAELDRLCYWTPGKYELNLEIHTGRARAKYSYVFSFAFAFELSDSDSRLLRLNADRILAAAYGRAGVQFNFAYADPDGGPLDES